MRNKGVLEGKFHREGNGRGKGGKKRAETTRATFMVYFRKEKALRQNETRKEVTTWKKAHPLVDLTVGKKGKESLKKKSKNKREEGKSKQGIPKKGD